MTAEQSARPPYVFVSYSHDSEEHNQRVLSLVRQLRADGIDAHCDREVIAPAQGWLRWMHDQVRLADYVDVVCSETYARRAEGRESGGLGLGDKFEGAIIGTELYEAGMASDTFHAVAFGESRQRAVPFFLTAGLASMWRVQPATTGSIVFSPANQKSIWEMLVHSGRRPRLRSRLSQRLLGALRSGASSSGGIGSAANSLGVAIDVSGSMQQSIPRDLGGDSSSRLQAVRASLEHIGNEARKLARALPEAKRAEVRVFAYGFGLRLGGSDVCDLLTLLRAARETTSSDEIAAATRDVEREGRAQASNYSSLFALAEAYIGAYGRQRDSRSRRECRSSAGAGADDRPDRITRRNNRVHRRPYRSVGPVWRRD